MDISVIGLGKLGAPLAAVLAYKGHNVIGVDLNPDSVRLINEGKAPVYEPQLDDLIKECRPRLSATSDYRAAVANTEITFIIVPTPSGSEGSFSLRHVLPTAESIAKGLREKNTFHLVVLTSTVMPGATSNQVLPVLELHSSKLCGRDFGLCYNPEFIALGSVIRDMLNPDFILIGESDSRSGEMLEALHKRVCDNDPPVARMNYINAELTKLAVNTFVTTKISYANMLAQVCERLPGANVDVVTSALGLDGRIGRKYLKGALGYGGPCFPRDNLAFSALARQLGAPAILAEATDRANRLQVSYLAALLKSKIPPRGVVGILGLAYKPNTNVIEESQGLLLAQALTADAIPVIVYDPAGMTNAREALRGPVKFAASAQECVQESDAVVVTTPWEEFRSISPQMLERHSVPRVLVDCWRLYDAEQYCKVTNFIALGVGKRLE
jgi:UDPglucose 6-dehydrogenase